MGKTKTKKYNRSKQSSRSKQSKTQSKRKYKLKGGKFFGQGAFGSVYGRPRLPCSSKNLGDSIVASTGDITTADPAVRPAEDIDEIQALKEVSKVFPKEFNINLLIEFDVIRRLKEHIKYENNFEELSRILVLPTKKCEINRDDVEANRATIYTDNWSNGKYENIPKQNMIIYPTLGIELHEYINSGALTNFDNVVKLLFMLRKVFRGIQMLQNYDFIHGDLKPPNILLSHDQTELYIIDLTDVRHIPTTNNMAAMPTAYMYYIWPSIVAYSAFFKDRDVDINTVDAHNFCGILSRNYRQENEKLNDENISRFLPQNLYNPFNITFGKGFSAAEIKSAEDKRCKLVGQKLFNYGISDPCSESVFMQKYNDPDEFKNRVRRKDLSILNQIKEMHSWFEHKSEDQQKLNLLKRVDIYSLGILLLECINPFISATSTIIPREICSIILNIFDVAYFCCFQEPDCVSIDEVVYRYDALLQNATEKMAELKAAPVNKFVFTPPSSGGGAAKSVFASSAAPAAAKSPLAPKSVPTTPV